MSDRIARAACLGVLALSLGGCEKRSTFSGSFISDGRPAWMQFLALTDSNQVVTGYLVIATPDGRGGTRGETVNLEGRTDGRSLTLRVRSFLNLRDVTLVGGIKNGVLTLTLPSRSGEVWNARFKPGTEREFNDTLKAWRASLAEAVPPPVTMPRRTATPTPGKIHLQRKDGRVVILRGSPPR